MRILPRLAVTLFAMTFLFACAAVAQHRAVLAGDRPLKQASAGKTDADPLSGEWDVTFHVGENTTQGTFTLKLDGSKVTGTVFSQHTGPGTIRDGSWNGGKLSLTLDFQKHESIAIKGMLKDGKLAGEFQTEGFTDKWEATKKAAPSNK